jgi:hypothetical protein
MEPYHRTSRRVRLEVESMEQRDTPSTLVVNLGNGALADAVLTMVTGAPGASGTIVGHAAPQSGVGGTIILGSGRQ